jgi:predicted dehydrogenase
MKLRFAFAGFRHPHIFALLEAVKNHPGCELVAACETDAPTRDELASTGAVEVTHASMELMLEEVCPDVVAIGDFYSARGGIALAALEAGCHVISDKPLCTSLGELKSIAAASSSQGLAIGCMLDLRENGLMRRLCEVARSGEIGDPCTISLFGQHPLRVGKRASWYFEPGKQGGTINDIGIHALDLAEWFTGREWESSISAREWNRKAVEFPFFGDCAQFHWLLSGGISVFTDVSYLAPDESGYALPQYWRVTVNGTKGVAETSYGASGVQVAEDKDSAVRLLNPLPADTGRYLENFLSEISGCPVVDGLTTAHILRISRIALQTQKTASAESCGLNGIFTP